MKRFIQEISLIVVMLLTVIGICVLSACKRETPPQTYAVTYLSSEGGTIQGEANQTVSCNENASTVTAVPNEGYKFVSWSDGVKTATRTDKTVTDDVTATAKFEKLNYSVVYKTDGNGAVQGFANQYVIYSGNASSVTAVPNRGYKFVSWSDGVETASRTDKEVTSNLSVTAKFEKLKYSVIYQTNGNGTIKGEANQTVSYNENASTVTAVPDEGYRFVMWSDGVKTATRTDLVKGDNTVTATFELQVSTVRYLTDGNGTIDGQEIQSVIYGESAGTVEAIPFKGYRFVSWSDGVETATRTDEAVKSGITVTAYFEKIKHQVTYNVSGPLYCILKYADEFRRERHASTVTFQVPDGGNAPIISIMLSKSQNGEEYSFLYWSDGVLTEERHDTDITSDLTMTAYFGYKINYTVNGNVGGRIGGKAEQKILIDGSSETVTAIPDDGYVFCGWSDLSTEAVRQGDFLIERQQTYYAVWEYIAYFEPKEKTFNYDYGVAEGKPLVKQITLNRDDIQAAEFAVPTYDGYEFCGWYADRDYRIRITAETGGYMYGYAAFTLETDTLFAKWRKAEEVYDPHKVLLVLAHEMSASLRTKEGGIYIDVYDKMCPLDYVVFKQVVADMYDLLNEWFEGIVEFEVDAFFTTQLIGTDAYMATALYASNIEEVSQITQQYHNTVTFSKYGGRAADLHGWSGLAGAKNACVDLEKGWQPYVINNQPLQDQQIISKVVEHSLNGAMHEFTHTAEHYFTPGEFHKAESYAYKLYGNMEFEITIKPYLLGEFEMDGVKCGIPREYWKYHITVHVNYVAQRVNYNPAGAILKLGKDENPKQSVSENIVYGSDFSVEAIPLKGFRFVKWSDGVTTAIRHDKNIIARLDVEAIFEKI